MKKEILLIVATHGDEKIGLEATQKLRQEKLDEFYDILIANPRAFKSNKRCVDKDLNRSYPGEKYSKYYEKRLAYKNLLIAQKYRYVIDIHEASQGQDDFIIVPKNELPKKFPLDSINLEKVLLWPNPRGPISQVLENAIELEFGSKNRDRKEMVDKAADVIKNFIFCTKNKKLKRKSKNKELFRVYGILRKNMLKNEIDNLIDFKKVEINREEFLPLLVGQYLKLGIICYKMKKM